MTFKESKKFADPNGKWEVWTPLFGCKNFLTEEAAKAYAAHFEAEGEPVRISDRERRRAIFEEMEDEPWEW